MAVLYGLPTMALSMGETLDDKGLVNKKVEKDREMFEIDIVKT